MQVDAPLKNGSESVESHKLNSDGGAYLWLNPIAQSAVDKGSVMLRCGRREVRFDGLGTRCMELLDRLDGQHRQEDLANHPLASLVLPALNEMGWLVRLATSRTEIVAKAPWLSRQLAYWAQLEPLFPDKAVAALGNKHVMVVGCGGVGSAAAFSLAGSGLGRLTLVDPDTVELSNLNRQFLYAATNVGQAKVHALSASLRDRFPIVNIMPVLAKLEDVGETTTMDAVDLVILSGGVSEAFAHPGLLSDQSVLIVGYLGAQGIVGPLLGTDRSPCWRCYLAHEQAHGDHSIAPDQFAWSEAGWNASGSTINLAVGAAASEVAVRFLTGLAAEGLAENLVARRVIDMRGLTMNPEPWDLEACRCGNGQ